MRAVGDNSYEWFAAAVVDLEDALSEAHADALEADDRDALHSLDGWATGLADLCDRFAPPGDA